MAGIGRECGKATNLPSCKRLNRNPASSRAASEKGGVFTFPCIQTMTFDAITEFYIISDI
jgi:hypothetical protein